METSNINLNRVNHLLLRKQQLTADTRCDDLIRVARDIAGLHGTNAMSPYLSLFARMRQFQKKDLETELAVTRSLGRIRFVRRTIYILPKDMLPVAYAATREMVQPLPRDYRRTRGISPEEYAVMSTAILEQLKGIGMTAQEIRKVLQTEANVSAIVNLMCDQGLLVRGASRSGWRSINHTYYRFDEHFPDVTLEGMDEAEARVEIIRRYLAAFGPATEDDIVWWTGLRRTDVRHVLARMKDEVRTTGIAELTGEFLLLRSDEEQLKMAKDAQALVTNLLPVLDPYLMAYRERDRYLDGKWYEHVYDRSGNATSTILLNGRIVGVWDFAEDREPAVKLFLFEEVREEALREIHSEARKTGKCIADKEVEVRESDAMLPLTRRTAGGYMSPLKSG